MRLLTLAAVALLAAGCTVEGGDSSEHTPPPGGAYLEVILEDASISMPDTSPYGTISFEISNPDDTAHSFAIEGPGVSAQLDDELDPIETAVLTLELEPGTYTVWCPIDDHRERGAEAQLVVTEEQADPGDDGTPADLGVGPGEEQDPIEDEGP